MAWCLVKQRDNFTFTFTLTLTFTFTFRFTFTLITSSFNNFSTVQLYISQAVNFLLSFGSVTDVEICWAVLSFLPQNIPLFSCSCLSPEIVGCICYPPHLRFPAGSYPMDTAVKPAIAWSWAFNSSSVDIDCMSPICIRVVVLFTF